MAKREQRPAPLVTIRPRRIRVVALVVAPLILAGYAWWGATLSGRLVNGGDLTSEDRWALVALGPIVAALALLPLRLRIDADHSGVRVRSFQRDLAVPWTMVAAVEFKRTRPNAALLLTNSESVQLLAIQVFDGPRAVAAIRELRALHAAARTRIDAGVTKSSPGGD